MCDLYYCDLIYNQNLAQQAEFSLPLSITQPHINNDKDTESKQDDLRIDDQITRDLSETDEDFDDDFWISEFTKFDPDDESNIQEQKRIIDMREQNCNKARILNQDQVIKAHEQNTEIFLKCRLLSIYQYKCEQIKKNKGNLRLFIDNYKKMARMIFNKYHSHPDKIKTYNEIIAIISQSQVWTK
jgi:hypothetical protein